MKTSTLVILVIVGFLILLGGCMGCGAISLQKRAVGLEENVRGKWADVQSEYQRRSGLIPNLVATVKGEANFERGTLNDVISARARASSMQINPENLTPENMQQFQAAQAQLSGALSRLLVTVEQYPNLRANEGFRNLQTQLEGTENRIKVARRDFNQATQDYNTAIRTFPNNIYAGFLGFKEKPYFEADPGSENAPGVDFSDPQRPAPAPQVQIDSIP